LFLIDLGDEIQIVSHFYILSSFFLFMGRYDLRYLIYTLDVWQILIEAQIEGVGGTSVKTTRATTNNI
jgi:hypothetical protein